jgi:hypothetical protein
MTFRNEGMEYDIGRREKVTKKREQNQRKRKEME